MDIKKDSIAYDEFMVVDESDNPVTGLTDGNFTKQLYDPNNNEVANISGGIPVTILEVGDGLYRTSFTPNELGNWVLLVYNATYFPWGKGASYQSVVEIPGNAMGGVQALIEKILGLSQSNYRIFSPKYDRNNNLIYSIIKTYPTANDCNNDTNTMAQYELNARFNLRTNLMESYKVVEI